MPGFRRYIAPQRDTLATLAGAGLKWTGKSDGRSTREALDRTIHHVEELDTLDRALAE